MSSHENDPLRKQETSSESNEPSTDDEIDEAEEDLGLLKIGENATKEQREIKPPNREGISTSNLNLLSEPVAGPSGLQNPRRELLSEPVAGPSGLQKKMGIENIVSRVEEGESDSSDLLNQPFRDVVGRFMDPQSSSSGRSLPSSSSRRSDYASDSASTSADISEIRSEIFDSSREGSVYRDAPEDFLKDESPSFVSALERQNSETTDTNISEIQDFTPSLPLESGSVSISTNTGEEGNRAYIERLQREAEERGVPLSTSSGIASTDQSELDHQQDWILAGERGYYRHDVDDPNQDLLENVAEGGETLSASESMEDQPNLYQQVFDGLFGQEQSNAESVDEPDLDQQMQHFDTLFGQAQSKVEETNVSEDVRGTSECRSEVDRAVQASGRGAGSPYKRRRPPMSQSESDISEREALEKRRTKHKPVSGKKSKMAIRKSGPVVQSRSESPEPKSSSSEELHRKPSPDIKSSSGSQEISMTRRSERMLRRQQHAMESVIVEEEDRTSPFREQDPGLMETEDAVPETIPERTAEVAKNPEEKSSESTDQAYGSGTDGALKEHESFESSEYERSAGKSKREPQPNSPPSDENLDSSAPKSTSRPKKRARSEKIPGKPRRTRHDSGGNVKLSGALPGQNVKVGDVKRGESTSSPDASDYSLSDDEKDAQS